ncbi:guanosine-5'-triphosphate,3'-diphosphate pyrophosphatase [Paraglaciecola aquimarina]|uniref:Guanosine-5'-triphosphate,3'-diphosphate pyrophosphatase n=1 Tax=Paraglaciecola aquimarina TaxID=1235557 RepID=A0ABU3SSI5_9ALTE|nr:guanosine-5'-triphosphate,3'-diphosphate pyrophosphatase [Paraglaciecola aquimarina]MDU0352950.1 guanosine-5'-triphosphate,3'-diphosphate pyrophosphatase [Paraglaciecola aquimarina]
MNTTQTVTSFAQPEQLYAAVDLGSNSFHMVVVRVSAGSVHTIGKVKQKVRLAAGLDENMYLDQASLERGWKCLEIFAERLQDIPLANIKIVGTATLRLAANADVFIKRAEQILQHKLNIIDGEEEARQIYLGVAYTSANQGNSLVIDIGGASTEIIVGNDMSPIHLVSLNMGCVTFKERFFADGVISSQAFEHAIEHAKALLNPVTNEFLNFSWQQCLGASGTPQAIVEILVTQGISDAIRLDYLHNLRQQCIDCTSIDLLEIDGLTEARRAIFPSGLAILIALFEQLSIEEMQISGGALREGLIYGMLDNMQQNDRRAQTLEQTIERFHIDSTHAHRVKNLSLNLFKQVQNQIDLRKIDCEPILIAASMLSELGMHIEYKQFHLHGAYILSYLPLVGYTQQQQTGIKALVQSHRQEIKLEIFETFHADVRDILMVLSRILRLSSILSIRRKDHMLAEFSLTIKEGNWTIQFPEKWLKSHPLIDAELANEKWQQHKVGWKLECF